jgi:hypothetical protein
MGGGVILVQDLPEKPLDAAAEFYKLVPGIRDDFLTCPEFNLTIVFDPAGQEHEAWRRAAIQALAREVAPAGRVNGVVGEDFSAIQKTYEWLQSAPGISGQLLAVDGKSAANG